MNRFYQILRFKSEHLINHNLNCKEAVLDYGTIVQRIRVFNWGVFHWGAIYYEL